MTTASNTGNTGTSTKILVVDDNEDAATLLADFLSTRGYDVKTAFTSADAIALVPGFDFQVAILDLGLPEMDGYELARRLRVDAEGRRLVALSGYGQPNDLAKSRDAGFDRHLVKPVDLARLLRTISELSPTEPTSNPS